MKVGFADDHILATKSKETLQQTLSECMNFFEERLLILNKTKSDILIISLCFGRKIISTLMGIKVKRQAKYLGFNYNVDLNINYSLKALNQK
jgi:anthranilate/para-aminobenzoate synthase component II